MSSLLHSGSSKISLKSSWKAGSLPDDLKNFIMSNPGRTSTRSTYAVLQPLLVRTATSLHLYSIKNSLNHPPGWRCHCILYRRGTCTGEVMCQALSRSRSTAYETSPPDFLLLSRVIQVLWLCAAHLDLLLCISRPSLVEANCPKHCTMATGSCLLRNLVLALEGLFWSSKIALMSNAEAISSKAFILPLRDFSLLSASSRDSHSSCKMKENWHRRDTCTKIMWQNEICLHYASTSQLSTVNALFAKVLPLSKLSPAETALATHTLLKRNWKSCMNKA